MLKYMMKVSAAGVRIPKLLTKLSASWLRATVADTGLVAFLGYMTDSVLIEVRVVVALHRDNRERRLNCTGTV